MNLGSILPLRNKKGQRRRVWIAHDITPGGGKLFIDPSLLPREDVGAITEYQLTSWEHAAENPDKVIWLQPVCEYCYDDDPLEWLPGKSLANGVYYCEGDRGERGCYGRYIPYRFAYHCWIGPARRYPPMVKFRAETKTPGDVPTPKGYLWE